MTTAGGLRAAADAQTARGDLARAAGDLAAAEQHFRAALMAFYQLEDRYQSARLLSAIANLHYVAGDYTQAADLSRQAAERMPGDAEALTGLAYALWLGGSPADAEVTFSQALRSDPYMLAALAGRGQVRADLGRYPDALDDLDQALEFGPADDTEADIRSARALALAGLERAREAADEIAAVLAKNPDRARTRLRAARVALLLHQDERARAELDHVLAARLPLSPVERDTAQRLRHHVSG
jgi:tetratricopeptide (TPR) repeat protein